MAKFNPPELVGSTPLNDYSGLKLSWVYTQEQLDAVEAKNIQAAAKKYLGKKHYQFPEWFTVEHINQVHKAMFSQVWDWAGKYRRTEKTIGIAPYLIPFELAELAKDFYYWSQHNTFTPLEIAARSHHRLVWIHPYENGNGRHARFIGDMVLKSYALPTIQWPKLINHGHERADYLEALKNADEGDFSSLITFLERHSI